MPGASIPVAYAGTLFRSRLHACWAAFFDLVAWGWEYQTEDFCGFTPAFRLDFHRPLYAVVDSVHVPGVQHPAFKAAEALRVPRLLVVGRWANWLMRSSSTLGLLASEDTSMPQEDYPRVGWVNAFDGNAEFAICTTCGRYAIFPETQSYHCQVCDAYDGGNNRQSLDGDELGRIWAMAQPGLVPLTTPSTPKKHPYGPFEDAP